MEGATKEIVKASKSVVVLLQSNGSKSVESGRVCVFVTWKRNILLHGADNFDTKVMRQNSWETHV